MNFDSIKYELQHILQGKGEVSHRKPIQAITTYLRKSVEASTMAQRNESNKSEETEKLILHYFHLLFIFFAQKFNSISCSQSFTHINQIIGRNTFILFKRPRSGQTMNRKIIQITSTLKGSNYEFVIYFFYKFYILHNYTLQISIVLPAKIHN